MILPFQFDSINVVTTSGIDTWGAPQELITASGVSARVELGNRIILTDDGEQSVASFTVFLDPDVSVLVGNRIVFAEDSYEVLQVLKHKDDLAVHHLEVIGRLQRRS